MEIDISAMQRTCDDLFDDERWLIDAMSVK